MKELTHYDLAAKDFSDQYDAENSFYDEDSEGLSLEETADNFSLRSSERAAARQERKIQRIEKKQDRKDLRADRKFARKNRGEIRSDQETAGAELKATSEQTGLPQETVALANVAANQPLVASYVESKGLTPQPNPAALALQATQLFNSDVEAKMQDGVPDYETAFDAVIEDEQDAWGEEADEFFGSVLTSVMAAGKALVNKINDKRKAKGKKPLFGGKGWEKIAKKVADNKEVVTDAMTSAEIAFLALTKKEVAEAKAADAKPLNAAKNAFVDDQTKQAFKQYAPIAAIVLIAVFIIGKNS